MWQYYIKFTNKEMEKYFRVYQDNSRREQGKPATFKRHKSVKVIYDNWMDKKIIETIKKFNAPEWLCTEENSSCYGYHPEKEGDKYHIPAPGVAIWYDHKNENAVKLISEVFNLVMRIKELKILTRLSDIKNGNLLD